MTLSKILSIALLLGLMSTSSVYAQTCQGLFEDKAVSLSQKTVIEKLLSEPEVKKFPIDLTSENTHELIRQLVPLLPKNPQALAAAIKKIYGPYKLGASLHSQLSYDIKFPEVFVVELLSRLSTRDQIDDKNSKGVLLLVEFLNHARFLEANNYKGKQRLSDSEKVELAHLLQQPSVKEFPIFLGDPNVSRIVEILQEVFPVTVEERIKLITETYGRDFAGRMTEAPSSNWIYLGELIQRLSAQGLLATQNGKENPLINLFD